MLTNNEGPHGKKIAWKSRNSCWASGGGVGAQGQLTRGSNGLSPRTKYKRSKNAFAVTSIAPSCVRVCSRLLQPLAQSLLGSPTTLPGTLALSRFLWTPAFHYFPLWRTNAAGGGGSKDHACKHGLSVLLVKNRQLRIKFKFEDEGQAAIIFRLINNHVQNIEESMRTNTHTHTHPLSCQAASDVAMEASGTVAAVLWACNSIVQQHTCFYLLTRRTLPLRSATSLVYASVYICLCVHQYSCTHMHGHVQIHIYSLTH